MAEQTSEHKTHKNDFVEIKFTGYANNEIFDSNIDEDIIKINPKAKADKLIVVIGQGMVVKGFDKELENKYINKNYEVNVKPAEAFGQRDRTLMKTIPLGAFTQQQVSPRPGMVLTLDNHVVKIIAVSGARVVVDFNNPLAGKELKYNFKIIRKIEDEKEKIESLLKFFFGFIPEFEVNEKIKIKAPKNVEPLIKLYDDKFKELLGKSLEFEEKQEEKADKNKQEHAHEQGNEHHREHNH